MITAVVTHYNKPKGLLERCIGSLEKFGPDYIIVDDASDNRCKLNDECLYVYDLSGSDVTKMPERKRHADKAKEIMKKELQEYQNGQICRSGLR